MCSGGSGGGSGGLNMEGFKAIQVATNRNRHPIGITKPNVILQFVSHLYICGIVVSLLSADAALPASEWILLSTPPSLV